MLRCFFIEEQARGFIETALFLFWGPRSTYQKRKIVIR
jgi:hypothetical protein